MDEKYQRWLDKVGKEEVNLRDSYKTHFTGTITIRRGAEVRKFSNSSDLYLEDIVPEGVPVHIDEHIARVLEKEGYKAGDRISYRIEVRRKP